jgi:hypothetical protein
VSTTARDLPPDEDDDVELVTEPLACLPGTKELDPAVSHPARVQDYLTGGKDNYEADRKISAELLSIAPVIADSIRHSRYFLARAIRYLATEHGVRQFLDVGAGLPTADNTHEIAQQAAPEARVVYADNDPLVMTYARALLTSGRHGTCGHVTADIRDPADVIAGAAATLNFTEPVAVLMVNVLTYVTDDAAAEAIVGRFTHALAVGSYVVLCHATAEVSADQMRAAVHHWNQRTATPAVLRTGADLARLLNGLELTDPGVVSCPRWRPDISGWGDPEDMPHLCAVARKPAR